MLREQLVVSEVSEPYQSELTATKKTLYTYRDDGRLLKQKLPDNTVFIDYSYVGNKTTTKYNTGEEFYKINDASGMLVESKDPGGLIKYFYESDGLPKRIEAPGGNTEFTYYPNRLQATLNDPDAGTTSYQYDGFLQLTSQIRGIPSTITYTYDKLGRIITETINGIIKTYKYDRVGALGKLYEITNGLSGIEESSEKYIFDPLTRVKEETRLHKGESFTYKYNYDSKGNISKVTYPAGMELNYTYNSFQELILIKNGTSLVWQRGAINPDGQIQTATFGNNKQITYTYDAEKRLNGMTVNDLIEFNYYYNNKQQLVFRDEKYKVNGNWIGFREDFTYDLANRLETVTKDGEQTLKMTYQANMIHNKSDAGTYEYSNSTNHQLTSVTPGFGNPEPNLSYTGTGKVHTINETGSVAKLLTLEYGVDDQRFKAEYKENSITKYTRYYFKDYEKEVSSSGTTRHLNYIYAGGSLVGIYEQKTPANAMHYIYTDHLGSIRCITNSAGVVEQGLSYDVWGNRRDPASGEKYTSTPTNLMFYRGYTGHEHLDELGLINMNGRVYDPYIALFLSPDNYVQNATNSQNFNRYTYCLNNPLIYTDPSGEFIWFVIGGAILGSYIGASTSADDGFSLNPAKWGDDWGKRAVIGGIFGMGAGALAATAFGGAGTMALMSNGIGGSSLGWSMTSSALTMGNLNMGMTALMGGDIDAVWKAGVSGLISGAITGGVNNYLNPRLNNIGFFEGAGIHGAVGGTTNLIDGAINGKKGEDLLWYILKGAGTSALAGGITEGISARADGKSFWTGGYKRINNYGQNGCNGQILKDKLFLSKPRSNFALTLKVPISDSKTLNIPLLLGWKLNKNPYWASQHWPNYFEKSPILLPLMIWFGDR